MKIPQETDHMTSVDIATRLSTIKKDIERYELEAGRAKGSVQLLAVSKTQPAEAVATAYAIGQRDFGENYAQELEQKAITLQDLDISWHFIGPLQSNKTRIIARYADWVHSIDRLKLAHRLSEQRSADQASLQVCLQVNIDAEETKSGVPVDAVTDLAQAVSSLPRLSLRGLMCIPERNTDATAQHQAFARMRLLMQQLNESGFAMDTLSMGMSADFPAAIAEGATIIRVGTAIFGARR